MEIIKVENLSFTYKGSKRRILDNISFSVRKGDFVILYGPSGSGKTTLLKFMKNELRPEGQTSGKVYYKGKDILEISAVQSANEIGFMMQNPESQVITDKVYRELAFGLENIGEDNVTMKRKTAEISSTFGIDKWFRGNTAVLSGGQKQLLNLASVMVMSPELIILDEPLSQLDPFSARSLVETLMRFNREYGVTVIIAEHILDEFYAWADAIAVIDQTRLKYFGVPRTCCGFFEKNDSIVQGLPIPSRIYQRFNVNAACPLDVREGREFLNRHCKNKIKRVSAPVYYNNNSHVIELENISFRYRKNSPDIIKNLTLRVRKGEVYAVTGGNGCGKTTLLSIICGYLRPYRGKILMGGLAKNKNLKISVIPQNSMELFTEQTLKDDLVNYALKCGFDRETAPVAVYDVCRRLQLTDALKNHPYDLSDGELQKAAVAKTIISGPDLILLDEPTKGVDAWSKKIFSEIVRSLAREGRAVIIVTHDNEFAAETADICGLLFDGTIVYEDTAREFYSQNDFYTTTAARMSKNFFENAVTFDDIIELCKKNGGVE